MRRLTLSALVLLAALCVPCAARPADDAAVEVPFTLEKGYIIVPAKVQGDKPVEVALATGLEHSVIDASLLEKYKLQAFYTGIGIITGSSTDRTVSYTNVPDVSVGSLKASISMRFGGQAAAVSQRVGREIFGVLGADFFKGRVVQFDFEKRVVRLLPRPSEAPKPAAGRAVLRFRYNADVMTLPIVEDVTFNGKKVKTLLDTGALAVVWMKPSAAKQAGVDALAGKDAAGPAKIGSLRLGELEFNDVPASPMPKLPDPDIGSYDFAAVAGVGLLQNFLATFDFQNKVVVLERH